jgi:bifunctional DNA-binding transcriptional regulator/antitoxin component of YhaV-PrlF toxin-antitoxin module
MMFELLNIRPISSWGNKQQLDNTGDWIVNIPKEDREYLEKLSKERISIIWKRADYELIIEKYKKLNEIEEKRLQINSKNI